jgi:hypothetical protein
VKALKAQKMGESLMIIVGAGKALIYPTGGCADPGNACAYIEAKTDTLWTCGNLSEEI